MGGKTRRIKQTWKFEDKDRNLDKRPSLILIKGRK